MLLHDNYYKHDIILMVVMHRMSLRSYVVAAISPSVVVPTALNLQSQGFGQASGIPTLIVAAASMDVVICISLFGVFLGLAFSEGMWALSQHVLVH